MRLRIAELARKKKGWSMKRLSTELGIEHQTVLLWNQGRSYPRLPMLLRLARLLRCRIENLLEVSPPKMPKKTASNVNPGVKPSPNSQPNGPAAPKDISRVKGHLSKEI